ncbi:MAG: type II secretion system F family protein, partial [Candidatus Zipacnadales bacterium]
MLKLLAEYTEHDLELHRMLSRETFYPKILAVAILTIVPGGMLIANSLSKGMFGFGMLVPVGIFAAMLLTVGLAHAVLRSYGQSAAGRRALDRMKLTLPVFGPLVQRIVMSRFTRALAALYSAGVLMPEAVPLAARAGGNTALAEDMRVCIPHLQQGGKLSEVLATIRHVPSTVISMLRTGEQTGNIDVVLNKVADYYDDETQTRIRQLGTTIMPICVIIAAIFVITILISFYVGYASKILSIAGSG